MLGRTDSRRRLLVLLTIFVIGSLALIARTAYWQVLNGDFPELSERIRFHVPDEKEKRHGQAIAAASLPNLKK